MAGPIHTKGVLILNGYLLDKYGQDNPISIAGNLVFEQSYSEIEGDSASSAELYTLISSLTQIPLKQSIAVTGSVNQKGEVQPVDRQGAFHGAAVRRDRHAFAQHHLDPGA